VRDGDVTAKGTEFVVAAGSERKGSVQLYEGQLEVRSANGQSRSLLAPSAANLHETVSTLALTDETRAFDEPLRRLVRRHREDSGSVLEISTRPDGAQVSLDDELLGPTPLSVLTNGGHRVTVSKPGYATITEWLEPRFDLPRQRTYELNPTNSETLSPETRTQATQERSATDPKALLSRAQDLRAKGKLRESVGVLQQLIQSHPASAEARVSLVSVGELELIEFGRPARALQAFESYLKAPGALTREARFGQIRALLALGRKEEAERGTRAFLKAYPNSIQAEQLRKRASSR
jgi:tetratricopeptide (TPR) repeat protein